MPSSTRTDAHDDHDAPNDAVIVQDHRVRPPGSTCRPGRARVHKAQDQRPARPPLPEAHRVRARRRGRADRRRAELDLAGATARARQAQADLAKPRAREHRARDRGRGREPSAGHGLALRAAAAAGRAADRPTGSSRSPCWCTWRPSAAGPRCRLAIRGLRGVAAGDVGVRQPHDARENQRVRPHRRDLRAQLTDLAVHANVELIRQLRRAARRRRQPGAPEHREDRHRRRVAAAGPPAPAQPQGAGRARRDAQRPLAQGRLHRLHRLQRQRDRALPRPQGRRDLRPRRPPFRSCGRTSPPRWASATPAGSCSRRCSSCGRTARCTRSSATASTTRRRPSRWSSSSTGTCTPASRAPGRSPRPSRTSRTRACPPAAHGLMHRDKADGFPTTNWRQKNGIPRGQRAREDDARIRWNCPDKIPAAPT